MGTDGQGQQDATRGGIGTMSRQAAKPAAGARPRPEAVPVPVTVSVPVVEPAERRFRQRRPQTLPQPRNARPAPQAQAPAPQRTASPSRGTSAPQRAPSFQAAPRAARAAVGSHRMPFVLLLCGLLGGALVSALVISTTLAQGSFQIAGLQQSTSDLARQQQALQEEVAQAQSAQVIQSRAIKLGMRPQGVLRFIDLKTGKTSSDHGGLRDAFTAPGFTP
jgi:hypothetical protein